MSPSTSQSLFATRKLPARYAGIVMPFLLSLLMTCIVSLISTFKSIGWGVHFLQVCPGAWALS